MTDSTTTLDKIRKYASELRLTPAALAEAAEIVNEPNRVDKLRQEWVTERLHDPEACERAVMDPRADFLEWLRNKQQDPFAIAGHLVGHITKRYHIEDAAMFAMHTWPQEIAWAETYRSSEDDFVAVLASIFLDAARRKSNKVFENLAQTYAQVSRDDPSYLTNDLHDLSPDEIRVHGVDPDFTPLCIRFSREAFGEKLEKMPEQALSKHAESARSLARKTSKRAQVRQVLISFAKHRPALQIGSILKAQRRGYTPDQLMQFERQFSRDLSSGLIDFENDGGARRAFLSRIDKADPPEVPEPSAEDLRLRRNAVSMLDTKWLDEIPYDLVPRERAKSIFEKWKNSIAEGEKTPAEDSILDFAFYAAENRAS